MSFPAPPFLAPTHLNGILHGSNEQPNLPLVPPTVVPTTTTEPATDPRSCTCCRHCAKKAPLTARRRRKRIFSLGTIIPWLPEPYAAAALPSRIDIEIGVTQTLDPAPSRSPHSHVSPTVSFAFSSIASAIVAFVTMASSVAQSGFHPNVGVHVKVKLVHTTRPSSKNGGRERDQDCNNPLLSSEPTLSAPSFPPPRAQSSSHLIPNSGTAPTPPKGTKSKGKRPAPLSFIPQPPLPISLTASSPSASHQPGSSTCDCPHPPYQEQSDMPPSSQAASAVVKSASSSASRIGRATHGHHNANNYRNNNSRWSDRLLSVLVPLSVLSFVIPAIVSALLHAFSLPAATASSASNRRQGNASSTQRSKSRTSRSDEHLERYRQLRASHLSRSSAAHNGDGQGKRSVATNSMPRSWSDPELGLKSPTAMTNASTVATAFRPSAPARTNRIPPLCELDKSASCPNLGRYARRHATSVSRNRNRSSSSGGTFSENTNTRDDDARSVCSSASTDDLDAISESTPFLLSPAASPQLGKPKTLPLSSEANAFQSSSAALHRDSAVFPSPTSSLFSSRSLANDPSTDPRKVAAPMVAFNPSPFATTQTHSHTTRASSATTTVAPSPPSLHLAFPDPPVAPIPAAPSAPTRFQLPTTPIDPQTHLRHLLACSGAAWWATRFAICDILTPRARRQLFLAQDMLIATSTTASATHGGQSKPHDAAAALGTVCMGVVSEPEAARQALMAQLARSARVPHMLPLLDVVMPPAASLPTGHGPAGVGTGVREAVVVQPLCVMGSVADRIRVRRLAPAEAKAVLGVVVSAMAKLANVGVVFRGFKLDYVLINGHLPDSQDLAPTDLLLGGYHAMFDTPLPTATVPKSPCAFVPPGSPASASSPTLPSDVVTPDAARSIADLLTVVGKAMDPTRVHEAFAGLMAGSLANASATQTMPGAWTATPQVQVKAPSATGPAAQQPPAGGEQLTWSQLLRDLGPVLSG